MKLPTRNPLDKLMNTSIAKKIKDFANSNGVAKFIVSMIVAIVVLIPTWLYFSARWLIEPADFWQELAVIIICGVLMGWLQVLLLIGGVYIIVGIITDQI